MLDNTYFIFLFTVFIYSFTDRKNKISNFHDNYCCIISVIIAVLWFPLLSLYFYIFLLFKCTASKFIKRTTILAWLWNKLFWKICGIKVLQNLGKRFCGTHGNNWFCSNYALQFPICCFIQLSTGAEWTCSEKK